MWDLNTHLFARPRKMSTLDLSPFHGIEIYFLAAGNHYTVVKEDRQTEVARLGLAARSSSS